MNNKEQYYDYEASKSKLTEQLTQMLKSDYSPTVRAKELEKQAEHLEGTANLLEFEWMELEYIFTDGLESEVDEINVSSESSKLKGHLLYTDTICQLREIADAALIRAKELPNSRTKTPIHETALLLIYVMSLCGKPLPKVYENSEAVLTLRQICEPAGITLSNESFKGYLSKALKNFDRDLWPPGLEDILVIL